MDWEAFYNRFREPDFVSGYEIQNRLGGGAFGEVYKARKHSIGKAYAIKFLKIDEDAQRAAIEHELEQVRHFAVIDHPNLVTIEDLGMVMGVPYLVMGYAGEETLARRLKQNVLDRDSALSYFVQTCRGVLALHDRRLVHFDLKPGNVFIKGDIARVGDYGLSKLVADGRLTLSFGRGTPHYMAPEVLRNRADHRADIYALGVILYECLAGKVPFEAESSAGIVLRETDDPPEFPPDFPADLRAVIERCLRLDPADRFQSVAELLEALGQTARQGDSITFDPGLLAEPPGSVAVRARASKPPASGEPRTPREQLRGTAVELARGAVEVARGVWDGIREASGSGEQDGVRKPPAPPAPEQPPRTATPAAGVAPNTIPVPPRVAGGLLGSVASTLVLGVEVLVTLLVAMWRGVTSGFARRHPKPEHSLFGRSLRGIATLALLAGLGAAIMYLLVVLMTGEVP